MIENNKNISKTTPVKSRFPAYTLQYCLETLINTLGVDSKKSNNTSIFNIRLISDNLGLSPKSSKFKSILASMKYYGLLSVDSESTSHYFLDSLIFDKESIEQINYTEIQKYLRNPPLYNYLLLNHTSDQDFLNIPNKKELENILYEKCDITKQQIEKFFIVFEKNQEFYKTKKEDSVIIVKNTLELDNGEANFSFIIPKNITRKDKKEIKKSCENFKEICISRIEKTKELVDSEAEYISFFIPFVARNVKELMPESVEQIVYLKLIVDLYNPKKYFIIDQLYILKKDFSLNTVSFNFNGRHKDLLDKKGQSIRKQQKKRNDLVNYYIENFENPDVEYFTFSFKSYDAISIFFYCYSGKRSSDKIYLNNGLDNIKLGDWFREGSENVDCNIVSSDSFEGCFVKDMNFKKSQALVDGILEEKEEIDCVDSQDFLNRILTKGYRKSNNLESFDFEKNKSLKEQGLENQIKGVIGENVVCDLINNPDIKGFSKKNDIILQSLNIDRDDLKEAESTGTEKVESKKSGVPVNKKGDVRILTRGKGQINISVKNTSGGARAHLASFPFFEYFLTSFEKFLYKNNKLKNVTYNRDILISAFNNFCAHDPEKGQHLPRDEEKKFQELIESEQKVMVKFLFDYFVDIQIFLLFYDINSDQMLDGLVFNKNSNNFDKNKAHESFEPCVITRENLEKVLNHLKNYFSYCLIRFKKESCVNNHCHLPTCILGTYGKNSISGEKINPLRPSFEGLFINRIIKRLGHDSNFSDQELANIKECDVAPKYKNMRYEYMWHLVFKTTKVKL